MRFIDRIGAAIVAPRRAFADAGDRSAVGRSGSDLLALIAILLVATQLRWLWKAGWLAGAVDVSVGLRAGIHVITRVLALDLGFLVVATIAIFIGSGAKREVGRSFDLACVAVLPLVLVDLAATTALHILDVPVVSPVMWTASAISYAWCALLVVLAIRPAAREPGRARLAGFVVIAVALVGTTVEGIWIARHSDLLRPMKGGEQAPPFALPTIVAKGELGPKVDLIHLRGRVVVVDFWETWCGPCLAAMPKLDVMDRKWGDRIAVLAINMDDKVKARAMFDARGFTMNLLADDFDTSERYGVSTIPHTVVIDREGTVRHVFRGATGTKVEAAVEALLK